ncbi:MAG: hypothetical protein WA921_05715 [Ahrensia sp.]
MKMHERKKIARAHSIGPKMIQWIEAAGYKRLDEFRGQNTNDVAFRIEIETGIKMNGNAIKALQNLIDHAEASA